jgi:hypothetical protein
MDALCLTTVIAVFLVGCMLVTGVFIVLVADAITGNRTHGGDVLLASWLAGVSTWVALAVFATMVRCLAGATRDCVGLVTGIFERKGKDEAAVSLLDGDGEGMV